MVFDVNERLCLADQLDVGHLDGVVDEGAILPVQVHLPGWGEHGGVGGDGAEDLHGPRPAVLLPHLHAGLQVEAVQGDEVVVALVLLVPPPVGEVLEDLGGGGPGHPGVDVVPGLARPALRRRPGDAVLVEVAAVGGGEARVEGELRGVVPAWAQGNLPNPILLPSVRSRPPTKATSLLRGEPAMGASTTTVFWWWV